MGQRIFKAWASIKVRDFIRNILYPAQYEVWSILNIRIPLRCCALVPRFVGKRALIRSTSWLAGDSG